MESTENEVVSLYTPKECAKIAKKADLRYVNDKLPGISRRKYGKTFVYYYPTGKRINDPKVLNRIQSLGIPPAYKQVWISPYANGHIQATGRDIKNRKQYIYHPRWTQQRHQNKFELMLQFGSVLPKIRKHVQQELEKPVRVTKSQIMSAIIYLLDECCIRIGTPIYAKEHQSYGLTTLRKKHISIEKNKAFLTFPGKSAQVWSVILQDKKIIRLLKKCEEIPGYELFKYVNENGCICVITSQEVNGYLKSLTAHPFTAKDFRTWAACRETLYRLIQLDSEENLNTKLSLPIVLKEVAKLLGHTPAVCQKNYIHPEIIQWWQDNRLEKWKIENKRALLSLTKDELLLYWLSNKDKCC